MSDLLTGMPVLSLVPSHHNLTYHLIVIVIAAIAAFIPRYFQCVSLPTGRFRCGLTNG